MYDYPLLLTNNPLFGVTVNPAQSPNFTLKDFYVCSTLKSPVNRNCKIIYSPVVRSMGKMRNWL